MPVNLKPIAFHTIVANGPWVGTISSTIAPNAARYFVGTGAPASGTLSAGNGMYNGQSSGFIVAAVMYAAGSGYSVGDVLTLETGTGTALQLTVDAVNGSGEIVDFHVSRVGNYSAYPDATAGVTGGGGSEAIFMATRPAADFYWDVTTPTNPNLWCCLTGGNSSASTWFNLTGCSS